MANHKSIQTLINEAESDQLANAVAIRSEHQVLVSETIPRLEHDRSAAAAKLEEVEASLAQLAADVTGADWLAAHADAKASELRSSGARQRADRLERRIVCTDPALAEAVAVGLRDALPGVRVIPTWLRSAPRPSRLADVPVAVVRVLESERPGDGRAVGRVEIDYHRTELHAALDLRKVMAAVGERGGLRSKSSASQVRTSALADGFMLDRLLLDASAVVELPTLADVDPDKADRLGQILACSFVAVAPSGNTKLGRTEGGCAWASKGAARSIVTRAEFGEETIEGGVRSLPLRTTVLVQAPTQWGSGILRREVDAALAALQGTPVDGCGSIEYLLPIAESEETASAAAWGALRNVPADRANPVSGRGEIDGIAVDLEVIFKSRIAPAEEAELLAA